MQGSLYNNPLFAQSLGTLVESFIGNPASEAQTQLMSSEALLNNQTAQYRDAIGETGLQGDLASMMIRALQAGPDYSRYAPGIGEAALGFQAQGAGSLGSAVSQAIMQQAAMAQAEHAQATGAATGARPTGAAPGRAPESQAEANVANAGYDLNSLTATEIQLIDRRLRQGVEGVDGAPTSSALMTSLMSGLQTGAFSDPYQAESYVLNPQNWGQQTQEVVTNPAGTMLTRALGWVDPNAPPDATEMQPVGPPVVNLPQAGAPIDSMTGAQVDPTQAIADARLAIAANPANRTEVLRRLAAVGIDPSGLGL
jgi:hypothetical protein